MSEKITNERMDSEEVYNLKSKSQYLQKSIKNTKDMRAANESYIKAAKQQIQTNDQRIHEINKILMS